jgi:hypothetical protein
MKIRLQYLEYRRTTAWNLLMIFFSRLWAAFLSRLCKYCVPFFFPRAIWKSTPCWQSQNESSHNYLTRSSERFLDTFFDNSSLDQLHLTMTRTASLLLVLYAYAVAAYDAQPPDCKELGLGEEYIHPGEDLLVSTCVYA